MLKQAAQQSVAPAIQPLIESKNILASPSGFGGFIATATRNPFFGAVAESAHRTTGNAITSAAKFVKSRAYKPTLPEDTNEVAEVVVSGDKQIIDLLEKGLMTQEGAIGAVVRSVDNLSFIMEGMATKAARERLEKVRADQLLRERNSEQDEVQEDILDTLHQINKNSVRKPDEKQGWIEKLMHGMGLGGIYGILKNLTNAVLFIPKMLFKGLVGTFSGIGKIPMLIARVIPTFGIAGLVIGAIASAFSIAGDAIEGADLSKQLGVSKVNAAVSFALGGMKKGYVNAFKQGGKFALIGATTGFFVAGPAGAILGGLLGAIVGGVAGFFGGAAIANKFKKIHDWVANNLFAPIGKFFKAIADTTKSLIKAIVPEFIVDLVTGDNPWANKQGKMTLSSIVGIWRKLLPPFVVSLIDGVNPFTKREFELVTIARTLINAVGKTISDFINRLLNGLKTFVVESFIDKGVVGKAIAKQFLTEDEYAQLEKRTRIKELEDKIKDKQEDIEKGVTGLGVLGELFGDSAQSNRDELARLQAKLAKMKDTPQPKPVATATPQNDLRGKKIEVQTNTVNTPKPPAPIVVQPTALTKQSTTINNSNAGIMIPRTARNTEPTWNNLSGRFLR